MVQPQSVRKGPTLTEVATSAGVSLPTASKVLHGHSGVAPETRRRVQTAIEKLSYVPRSAAMRSVVVMSNRPNTPYAMEVLLGITMAAEEIGVDVILSRFQPSTSPADRASSTSWARRLALAGRSGAIILTAHLSDDDQSHLAQEHLPVVSIDPLDPGASNVPSIGSTNFTGGLAATEHLISLGHRRLAAIGGPQASVAARARMHGFRAACSTAGIQVDETLTAFADFTYESGLANSQRWLTLTDRPTAIIAGSDPQALGVLEAARRQGLDVPHDLSVVGYDDTFVASWATPPLTTVRQPLQAMGALALETTMLLVDGRAPSTRHVELATELVVRGSTARYNEDPAGS